MTYKANYLVEEVIAEIKRDVSMDNLMALREMIQTMIDHGHTHTLTRFLSEFPELREPFKDKSP